MAKFQWLADLWRECDRVNSIGKIAWIDLTVENCRAVADFYQSVMGWDLTTVDVEDYQGFCAVMSGTDTPIAEICHKRAANQSIPSQWLMYVMVEDLEQGMRHCEAAGSEVIIRNRDMGSFGQMSINQDPAGAHCAIVQSADD